ncbi:hypothetical protein [Pilimelia terevasa]|nr:hypothetical protein [Pilimelia terevasa]
MKIVFVGARQVVTRVGAVGTALLSGSLVNAFTNSPDVKGMLGKKYGR